MYDLWGNFYNTGSTYAYMDYKKNQKKKNVLKANEVMNNNSEMMK